ncbi:MAG: hypothetical protein ACR2HE_10850 [Casimicrobiaceae bacterium]
MHHETVGVALDVESVALRADGIHAIRKHRDLRFYRRYTFAQIHGGALVAVLTGRGLEFL